MSGSVTVSCIFISANILKRSLQKHLLGTLLKLVR